MQHWSAFFVEMQFGHTDSQLTGHDQIASLQKMQTNVALPPTDCQS
jgi:hypothetical protein